MLREMIDYPDILRDKTVNITLQGGRELLGLQLIAKLPMIGLLEFVVPGGMSTFIRQEHISCIEIWDS